MSWLALCWKVSVYNVSLSSQSISLHNLFHSTCGPQFLHEYWLFPLAFNHPSQTWRSSKIPQRHGPIIRAQLKNPAQEIPRKQGLRNLWACVVCYQNADIVYPLSRTGVACLTFTRYRFLVTATRWSSSLLDSHLDIHILNALLWCYWRPVVAFTLLVWSGNSIADR